MSEEERIRVSSIETFMREGEWGKPPRRIRAQVWHLMPWARGFDEERFRRLMRVELELEHPASRNPDEIKVQTSAPAVSDQELEPAKGRG